MAIAALLRQELFKASQYKVKKARGDLEAEDFTLEPWLPVLRREIPIKAHAHRADDILTAIRIAREFQVDITLDHCTCLLYTSSPEQQVELVKDLDMRLKDLQLNGYARSEGAEASKEDFYSLYGGLFFLGIFLGVLFLMATVLIIYYKQISEGFDDKERFEIMQTVGMSKREVKKSIHSQVIMVFFLPLVTAVIHICFACLLYTSRCV